MKIRWKLTLISTLTTALIVLIISLAVYFFSARYRSNEFYSRLRERAHISAQLYLKRDEMGPKAFQELRRKYMHSLPKEHFTVFDFEMHPRYHRDSLGVALSDAFIHRIKDNGYAETKADTRQAVGMLEHDNEGDFIVVVSAIDQYGIRKLRYLKNILIVCFLFSIGGIFFSGYFFAGQALNPIARIINEVNQITASRLDRRLPSSKNRDELNELANTFNRMLDRLQTSFQMQKNFISNASHQLKTPLTSMLGEAEVTLSKQRSQEEYQQALQTTYREAQRLNKLISRLLSLARTDFDNKEQLKDRISFAPLVQEICEDLEHSLGAVYTFQNDLGDQCTVRGNRELLYGALTNVLENGAKFSNNKEVQVHLTYNDQGAPVLQVKDQGIGIPEQELQHITEPFYRSSNARSFQGFGVGLSLSKQVIELHGGSMHIQSVPGKGTEVRFNLKGLCS